jgi:voltage-gated potassium channel
VKYKKLRQKLYEIIFEADTSAGRLFNVLLLFSILASVAIIVLESVGSVSANYGGLLRAFEWLFTVVFTLEYLARIWTVDKKKKYIFSFFGIIDLLSILPSYLALFLTGAQSLMVIRSFRLLRIFRIFKLSRYVGEVRTWCELLNRVSIRSRCFL